MALVKFASPVAAVRGTVGGLTYSANGSTPYVKAWAKGANPNSPKQTTERSNLARMSKLWRDLSAAQRTAWDVFAALAPQDLINSLGEVYSASGFNWFCKCNIRLLRVARSTIAAVPTQSRPAAPAIDGFRVTTSGSDPDLATGGTASASTEGGINVASRAFDDVPSQGWNTSGGNTTGWLQYVLSSTKVIRGYSVYIDNFEAGGPKDWTFERLDPGPTWVPIDTQTGQFIANGTSKTYYCANETTSTTYRLNVSANNGDANFLFVYEMEYFEAVNESSVIIYPDGEFEAATDWDLILHISQGQTATRNAQYPGFAEIVASITPGESFELFQDELEEVYGTILDNRSWFARLYRQTQEGIRSAAATASIATS